MVGRGKEETKREKEESVCGGGGGGGEGGGENILEIFLLAYNLVAPPSLHSK